jgi:hypothetical protein
MISEIQKDVVGMAILRDWLGDGGQPVEKSHAEARSRLCLQCPEHRPAKWWEIFFKDPVARSIRRTLEIKRKADLRLTIEESLGMCRVCGCCMRLKCWTPAAYIAEHTSEEKLAEYPKTGCWIRTEIEALKKDSHGL